MFNAGAVNPPDGWPFHCDIPTCPSPATVISPGTDGVRQGHYVLSRTLPDVSVCLHHAACIGWPWRTEKPERAHG